MGRNIYVMGEGISIASGGGKQMRKKRIISFLTSIVFCLTMITQPLLASEPNLTKNQVNTIIESKAYQAISSNLEKLGYKANVEMSSSEIVEQLPCKRLDKPVTKVTIPFNYRDKSVDLLLVRDGEQEIAGAGIEIDEQESRSMVKNLLHTHI